MKARQVRARMLTASPRSATVAVEGLELELLHSRTGNRPIPGGLPEFIRRAFRRPFGLPRQAIPCLGHLDQQGTVRRSPINP
jgi:hypothetical protein